MSHQTFFRLTESGGRLFWDAEIHPNPEATFFRVPVRLPAHGTARLRWEPEGEHTRP